MNPFERATGWIVTCPTLSALLLVILSIVALAGYLWPGAGKIWIEGQFQSSTTFAEDAAPTSQVQDGQIARGSSQDAVTTGQNTVRSRGLSRSSDVVLVCESDQFFTVAGANAMRDVVKGLEAKEIVGGVMWMDLAPPMNLFGLPEPLLPRGQASERKFERSRERAMQHPFVGGQLVSEDGRVMPLYIRINRHLVFDDDQILHGLRKTAEEIAARYPEFEVSISTTGSMPMVITALSLHESNRLLFQIVAYAIILIMSVVLFRGLIATFVLALAPAIGVFWTLGFERLFLNFGNNPFVDVVLPILVSLVGFTDGVHLLVQIRRNRAEGMPGGVAAVAGLRQVGLACALTSLTTAIGFGSLHLADHELVRQFGHSCVLGVVLTFTAVIVVIPLACRSPLGFRIHVGHQRGVIDRNLDRIAPIVEGVLKRPGTLSAVAVVSTLALAGCTLMLRPDDRRMDSLPRNSEPALALRKLDESLGGLEEVEIRIDLLDAESGKQRFPELLDVTDEIHDAIDSNPLFSRPISLTSLLAALPGEGSSRQRASLVDLLPPPMLEMFSNHERNRSIVRFRVQDIGIATYGPAFENFRKKFAEIEKVHPGIQIDLHGGAVWRWENLYQIVIDLASSLGLASIIIFVVLAIAYRSLHLGLISIIPNVFPLAVAGAWMYLTGQALEVVSVCAFICCLGIAVDDTIHFLTRYVEEDEKVADRNEAIRRAFATVGTALLMTTLVLVTGLCSVLLSDSREHRTFATLGAITLASALFADLIFLPAIISVFDRKRNRKSEDEN